MYIGNHVKCLSFLSDFNETLIFSTDFRKIIKYQENPPSGSLAVPRGRTDGQTVRHDEAKAPKNCLDDQGGILGGGNVKVGGKCG
jgi:hypothetical protein